MGANKEYYLKLQEEDWQKQTFEQQLYLNNIGMEVRQKETKNEESDEHYKKLKKNRIDAWQKEQEYLFKKRNNMK